MINVKQEIVVIAKINKYFLALLHVISVIRYLIQKYQFIAHITWIINKIKNKTIDAMSIQTSLCLFLISDFSTEATVTIQWR